MIEVSGAYPTPEQVADALLAQLEISRTDRDALKQANGGTDLRDQLITDLRQGGINQSALQYIGGGKYRGHVGIPKETEQRLLAWSQTDGKAPAHVLSDTNARVQELQAQGEQTKHQAELALRKQEAKQQLAAGILGAGGAQATGVAITRGLPQAAPLLTEALPPLALGTGIIAGITITLDKGLELGVKRQMEEARNPPVMMSKEQDGPPLVDTAQQPSAPVVPTDDELPKGELVTTGTAQSPATTTPQVEAKSGGSQPTAPQSAPPGVERIIPPLVIGTSLGKLAADKAHETREAAKPLKTTPTGDKDSAAVSLALRIGGIPSVKIEGYGDREFDVVSDKYIGQTTNSVSATKTPSNYLNPSKKAQLRETLRVAAETGRTALFEFTAGTPSTEVTDFLKRNAERVGAKYEVTVWMGDKSDVTGNH